MSSSAGPVAVVDIAIPAPRPASTSAPIRTKAATRWAFRIIVIAYITVLILVPVGLVFWRTFENGFGSVWDTLTTDSARSAFTVTAILCFWTVIGNTIFGVTASLLLVRHQFPGKRMLSAFIDLPFAVSPVVVGLALIQVYGKHAPIGGFLESHVTPVIFALPGMTMATLFVTLPFVVREIVPVLEEIGDEQEKAAWTLGASKRQTFFRITLPSIRWALAYGIVLTLARALGEYGAVAVVSGRVLDKTLTSPLYVDTLFTNFDQRGAYTVAMALAFIAILSLLVLNLLRPKEHT